MIIKKQLDRNIDYFFKKKASSDLLVDKIKSIVALKMRELVVISRYGFPYSKVWVKEESVISNNLQSIFLILLNREDRSLLWMVQWSKKCEWFIFSTTVINDSANLENYAWIYAHEDDWDQHWVLLETWFLADYEIQMHCLEKVLSTLVWCFESSINIWVSQIRVNIIPFDNGRWKKEFF